MSGKNQYPVVLGPLAPTVSTLPVNSPGFSWQTTSPATGFLPLNINSASQGSAPSGLLNGVMSSTNTIYSQILDISRMDNMGLEVTWTGTPTGTFSVMVSNSGINFYALTFNPVLTQPAGSAGGYAIDLNQLPFKYLMLQYVNASGSGTIAVYGQVKDLN
jgi:hypothetical protein